MEDGAKEDSAQRKEPKFLGKAGWVKKATGRLLAGYKDRYIHVEKTEIVVYENEDLQTCLERLDLENYDKCHELRSAFKKKNRLVLIRGPKSGNKVHDVKFQAQNPEEKDAWIKALSDGINRAKNKVFDEVKTDESSNLEHVTRTRPKGNRNRRPPTRIHMKEVADVSSDGILRLDLDVLDATVPNGTHYVNADATETPKEAIKIPMPPSNAREAAEEEQSGLSVEEEPQTEPEPSPQKKVLKPPMPPSKEAKSVTTPEDEPPKEDGPEKKVLKPPMPPSKEAKPSASPVEESTKEANTDSTSEKSPDARKKTGPPPTPPNKPINSTSNLAEAPQSRPDSQPPTPPSKDKKPSPAVELNQEVLPSNLDGTTDENKEEEDEDQEKMEAHEKVKEMPPSISISKEALPDVKEDLMITDPTESTNTEGHPKVSEPEESEESALSSSTDNSPINEPQMSSQRTAATPSVPTEPYKKSPAPPTPFKKKPVKPHPSEAVAPFELCQPHTKPTEENTIRITQLQDKPDPTASPQTASDTSVSSPHSEETLKLPLDSNNDIPAVVLSLNDPVADSPSLSPLLCRSDAEKKERVEEKSVDSGQHSDDDSEGSENGDMLATSTAALKGSHAGLDMLDVSEDDTQITDSLGKITDNEPPATKQAQVKSKVHSTFTRVRPIVPLKPSIKVRYASSGDLLSESSGCAEMRQYTRGMALGDGAAALRDDVMNLESEVALEMEKTGHLLSRVSQSSAEGVGEGMPEDLLAKAMEKLKRADHFLREVKKLKDPKHMKNESKRHSW
ncbi:proteoglycan 4 [Centroberyx affinis]|uniref:proteoglycan 4 n=1 Tax=Centroberyx affinis TaxID=166261 RepID=UPI003A5BD0E1